MQEVQLKQREVRTIILNDDDYYFYVQDIKDNCPDLKIETSHIIYDKDIPLVMAKYVHVKTEFDNMITKAWNYKPSKKDKES